MKRRMRCAYPAYALHQSAGLAEAFVLLEQGDQVFERGVERVGLPHLLGDLLDARGYDVTAVFGLLDLLGIFFGDVGDGAFVGQLVDQARINPG